MLGAILVDIQIITRVNVNTDLKSHPVHIICIHATSNTYMLCYVCISTTQFLTVSISRLNVKNIIFKVHNILDFV